MIGQEYQKNQNYFQIALTSFLRNKKSLTYFLLGAILVIGSGAYFWSSKSSADVASSMPNKNFITWSRLSANKLSEFKNDTSNLLISEKEIKLNLELADKNSSQIVGEAVKSQFDSGFLETKWETVSWLAETPTATNVKVSLRASDNIQGLNSALWSEVVTSGNQIFISGTKNHLSGRFADIKITLASNNLNFTPSFNSLTLVYSNDSFKVNCNSSGENCLICKKDPDFTQKIIHDFASNLVNFQGSRGDWKETYLKLNQSLGSTQNKNSWVWPAEVDKKVIKGGVRTLNDEDVLKIVQENLKEPMSPVVLLGSNETKSLWTIILKKFVDFSYIKKTAYFSQVDGLPDLGKTTVLPSNTFYVDNLKIGNASSKDLTKGVISFQVKPYLISRVASFYDNCSENKRSVIEARSELKIIIDGTLTLEIGPSQTKNFSFNYELIQIQTDSSPFVFSTKKEF